MYGIYRYIGIEGSWYVWEGVGCRCLLFHELKMREGERGFIYANDNSREVTSGIWNGFSTRVLNSLTFTVTAKAHGLTHLWDWGPN